MEKSITSDDYKVFLRYLRMTREEMGLTQVDVAERLGETQTFVSKCERGERRIDLMELKSFCGALGVSLSHFVKGLEQQFESASSTAIAKRALKKAPRLS